MPTKKKKIVFKFCPHCGSLHLQKIESNNDSPWYVCSDCGVCFERTVFKL